MWHYILTIQAHWGPKPTAMHTIQGVLEANGRTRETILKDLMALAINEWRKAHNISANGYCIVFFSLEKNTLNG